MNKKFKNVSGTFKLGICFAGILAYTGGSYASDGRVSAEAFELKITEETLGGSEIMAGEYAAAIETILTTASLDSKYDKSTNLCAAYTAQKEFGLAEHQCHLSLRLSESANVNAHLSGRSYLARREGKAVALINLGVLHALQGNNQEAREYFESASKKSKRLRATSKRNINSLDTRMDSQIASS
ncbi:MAG: tetratricopeptide (TPR) repeat protein [Halioglobus sp.]|jgi:tetratricopeptide (TPR) repeat protein